MSFRSKKPQDEGEELTGNGIGEKVDFLSQENHIFVNKLNYICKNYDTNFKDVSLELVVIDLYFAHI